MSPSLVYTSPSNAEPTNASLWRLTCCCRRCLQCETHLGWVWLCTKGHDVGVCNQSVEQQTPGPRQKADLRTRHRRREEGWREERSAANLSRPPTCGVDGALVSPFQRRDERQGIVHVVSSAHGKACDSDGLLHQAQDVCGIGRLPPQTVQAPAPWDRLVDTSLLLLHFDFILNTHKYKI